MAPEATPSIPFAIQRVTLTAGEATAIVSPATPGPWSGLSIYSVDAGTVDVASYLDADGSMPSDVMPLPQGVMMPIVPWQPQQGQFRKNSISGYISSASGGDVVFLWC
jgi:hypothetical protein